MKIVVAHPSADLYGSDLQMLQSVRALTEAGHEVTVVTPDDGELIPRICEAGASWRTLDFPVLRRSGNPAVLAQMAAKAAMSIIRITRFLRSQAPNALYVNTVTIPWWLVASRISGVPALCHVHEAEGHESAAKRNLLYRPLLLANKVIMISQAAWDAGVATVPAIAGRTQIIRNGVPLPDGSSHQRGLRRNPLRVGVVARLSPRKGTMDALEAVALARSRSGSEIELHLFGSVFAGYEWYEAELRERAGQPDLAGCVVFHGYVSPAWRAFDEIDVCLAPSHIEPYGNSVVEAQYSHTPVIVSSAAGHLESVRHEATGLVYQIGDVEALAHQILRLASDEKLADELADAARDEAVVRNSPSTYSRAICEAAASLRQIIGDR